MYGLVNLEFGLPDAFGQADVIARIDAARFV
jgi:hypothetical protein